MEHTEWIIEARGVHRSFRGRRAVQGINLNVPAGSVYGFLGPNGAGKTTTVRLILGILAADQGSMRVLGLDPLTQGEQVRAQCGVLLDRVGLYERLTGYQNLEFAARIAHLTGAEQERAIQRVMERVDLWDRRHDLAGDYSKGMRQKLGLARALLCEPPLLILDEPTSGLDPESIHMLRELMHSLAHEGGRTLFLCTHNLDEAERLCSRVAVIKQGAILAEGDPKTLGKRQQRRMRLRIARSDQGLLQDLTAPVRFEARGSGDHDATFEFAVQDDAQAAAVLALVVGRNISVYEAASSGQRLEDVYLELVREGQGEA